MDDAAGAMAGDLDVAAGRHMMAFIFPCVLLAVQYPTLSVIVARCLPFLVALTFNTLQ